MISKQQLKNLVSHGREIEFEYEGKKYSITYYNDNRKKRISFCEFYKKPIDCSNVDELCDISWDGIKVIDMLSTVKDKDTCIF